MSNFGKNHSCQKLCNPLLRKKIGFGKYCFSVGANGRYGFNWWLDSRLPKLKNGVLKRVRNNVASEKRPTNSTKVLR